MLHFFVQRIARTAKFLHQCVRLKVHLHYSMPRGATKRMAMRVDQKTAGSNKRQSRRTRRRMRLLLAIVCIGAACLLPVCSGGEASEQQQKEASEPQQFIRKTEQAQPAQQFRTFIDNNTVDTSDHVDGFLISNATNWVNIDYDDDTALGWQEMEAATENTAQVSTVTPIATGDAPDEDEAALESLLNNETEWVELEYYDDDAVKVSTGTIALAPTPVLHSDEPSSAPTVDETDTEAVGAVLGVSTSITSQETVTYTGRGWNTATQNTEQLSNTNYEETTSQYITTGTPAPELAAQGDSGTSPPTPAPQKQQYIMLANPTTASLSNGETTTQPLPTLQFITTATAISSTESPSGAENFSEAGGTEVADDIEDAVSFFQDKGDGESGYTDATEQTGVDEQPSQIPIDSNLFQNPADGASWNSWRNPVGGKGSIKGRHRSRGSHAVDIECMERHQASKHGSKGQEEILKKCQGKSKGGAKKKLKKSKSKAGAGPALAPSISFVPTISAHPSVVSGDESVGTQPPIPTYFLPGTPTPVAGSQTPVMATQVPDTATQEPGMATQEPGIDSQAPSPSVELTLPPALSGIEISSFSPVSAGSSSPVFEAPTNTPTSLIQEAQEVTESPISAANQLWVRADPVTVEAKGSIDLSTAEAEVFNQTVSVMTPFFEAFFKDSLLTFQLGLTFQESKTQLIPVGKSGSEVLIQSYFTAEVNFLIASDNMEHLIKFDTEKATKTVEEFYRGAPRDVLLELLYSKGIDLESLKVYHEAVSFDEPIDSAVPTSVPDPQLSTENAESEAGGGSSNAYLYAGIASGGVIIVAIAGVVYRSKNRNQNFFKDALESISDSLYNDSQGPPGGKMLPVLSTRGNATARTAKSSLASMTSRRSRIKPAALTLRGKKKKAQVSVGSVSTLDSSRFKHEQESRSPTTSEEKTEESDYLQRMENGPDLVASTALTYHDDESIRGLAANYPEFEMYHQSNAYADTEWSVDGLTLDDASLIPGRPRRWQDESSETGLSALPDHHSSSNGSAQS